MRLTTDTPKNNLEMALNLFYVKDKDVWVRGYGKGGEDISLLDLTREILSHQCPYVDSDISDDDMIMMMPEWLFDDVRTTEHVIGLLYQAAWVCAELREHLKQYEDKEAGDGKTDKLVQCLPLARRAVPGQWSCFGRRAVLPDQIRARLGGRLRALPADRGGEEEKCSGGRGGK